MDSEYFRYIMGKKGFTPESLGKELGVSRSQMNYKILKGSFTLRDIKKVIKVFEMEFEKIFQ
jgi:DNA-binding XRE family transcriptional regulator